MIKLEKNRKKLTIVLMILMLFMLQGCTTKNNSVRLRILANSNSEQDQQNKYKVKEVVRKILNDNMNISSDELKEEIKKEINEDFVNTIKVEYTFETFPAKSYQGEFIPSGTYYTLLITIGSGCGKNFWTLLYPDYFNISFEDDNEIEYRSYIYDKITS